MKRIYEYLNKEDELNLLKRYKLSGDTSALDELVQFNQLNVKMIVDRFFWLQNSTAIEYDDLISEANVLLIKSIEHFDLESKNRLVSFSTTIIRNGVMKFIFNNDSTIRVPPNQHLNKSFDTSAYKNTEPLDSVSDTISGDNLYDEWFKKKLLDILLDNLSPEDKFIIEYTYGLNNKPKLKLKMILEKFKERFNINKECAPRINYITTRRKRIETQLSQMIEEYKTRI